MILMLMNSTSDRKLEIKIMNYFRDRIQAVKAEKSKEILFSTRNIPLKKQYDYQFSEQNIRTKIREVPVF